jgi:hypothetical protein
MIRADEGPNVKTYIGQRDRDKVLRVWVEHHGRRYPIRPSDLPRRILTDLYGLGLPPEDLELRCEEFRAALIEPRLNQSQWTLSETEVRAWNANFVERQARLKPRGQGEAAKVAEGPDEEPDADSPETPLAEEATRTLAAESLTLDVGAAGQDVLVAWGKEVTRAKILHVTSSVLLLEGDKPRAQHTLKAGTPVRVGRPGRPPTTPARLAADGQGARYLLALGLRAVRGTQRVRVDVPALVGAPGLPGPVSARIVDLSTSGVRVRGLALQPGADCEVSFVPPGRQELVTARGVVVHQQMHGVPPEIGVAFRGAGLDHRGQPIQTLAARHLSSASRC